MQTPLIAGSSLKIRDNQQPRILINNYSNNLKVVENNYMPGWWNR